MNSAQIEHLYEKKGVKHGGILLLQPEAAIEMVEHAKSCGVEILGLDAFLLIGDAVQPRMEDGFDFTADHQTSGLPKIPDRWEYTKKHLQKYLHKNIWFEVVLE